MSTWTVITIFNILPLPYYHHHHLDRLTFMTDLNVSRLPETAFSIQEYDEKLEAECILRTRTVFDEFVCPKTGIYIMCTFGELLSGINRLWALAQEFKGNVPEIHEWVINLPLIFMNVLVRIIEREYTQEDHEKTSADPQLGETLLTIFYDTQRKAGYFRVNRSQAIIYNTFILYVRHMLIVLGLEPRIRRIKWKELKIMKGKIIAPFREVDFVVVLEAFRHFRDNILPSFSKGKVYYQFWMESRIPEVMEPTWELQNDWADFILEASAVASVISFLLLLILNFLEGGGGDMNDD